MSSTSRASEPDGSPLDRRTLGVGVLAKEVEERKLKSVVNNRHTATASHHTNRDASQIVKDRTGREKPPVNNPSNG